MHDNLLTVGMLTVGFTLASFFGYVMQRLRLPSILGYLIAGYIIGPYSPGFVADASIAEQLAEIGVILMLFGVGLHFKLEDLVHVKNIAIPGAIGQTLVSTACTAFLVTQMGWSLEAGIIIGLAVGVASTVVLIRLLTDNNLLHTQKGHIAVGWLIVEDIFTVIILILLPSIATIAAGQSNAFLDISNAVLLSLTKFFVLALFVFTIGQKAIVFILTGIARLKSPTQELFTLTILALVFLIAMASSVVFGTSIALGAFLAGMVIGRTNIKHQAAANALPIKDLFAVIFFLSVGMLFNPTAIADHFPLFLGIIAIIVIVKPLVAFLITLIWGYPLNVALTVAISLAQIGEFSFILAEEANNLKLIPDEGFDLLVACAMVSIFINPLLFKMIDGLDGICQKFTFKMPEHKIFKSLELKKKPSLKVLVIGFGPIGRDISKTIKSYGAIPVIIEQNIDTVTHMEKYNSIFFGDATDPNILKEAHIEEAEHLLITIPEIEIIVKIIHAARMINPDIQIIARLQFMGDRKALEDLNVKYVCAESEVLKSFTDLLKQFFKSKHMEQL